mgnify:CR=1 FL=1
MKVRFALAAALVLALLGAAAALMSKRFDPDESAIALREYVRDRYGRDLQLEGPLRLRLWPVLSISVPRTRLSETGSDDEAARFDSAVAEVSWLPLLRGRVIVERLRINGLHARVLRRADGSRNVDNLVDPLASTPDTAPGDDPPARPARVEIGRVEILGSSIEYLDQASGRSIWMDDIELNLDELASRMVTPASLRGRLVIGPEGASVLVRIAGTLDTDPARRTIGMRGVEATARGFIEAQSLDINARARRAALRLEDSGWNARLESFALGLKGAKSNVTLDTGHIRGASIEFDSSRLSFSAASVEATARGKALGLPFEAAAAIPELSIADAASRGKAAEAAADDGSRCVSAPGSTSGNGHRRLALNRLA